jgi:hypothetical protein
MCLAAHDWKSLRWTTPKTSNFYCLPGTAGGPPLVAREGSGSGGVRGLGTGIDPLYVELPAGDAYVLQVEDGAPLFDSFVLPWLPEEGMSLHLFDGSEDIKLLAGMVYDLPRRRRIELRPARRPTESGGRPPLQHRRPGKHRRHLWRGISIGEYRTRTKWSVASGCWPCGAGPIPPTCGGLTQACPTPRLRILRVTDFLLVRESE